MVEYSPKQTDRSTRLPLIPQIHQKPAKIQNIALNKLLVHEIDVIKQNTSQTNYLSQTINATSDGNKIDNCSTHIDQYLSINQTTSRTIDQEFTSLADALNQNKFSNDKSFEYIKPTSFHQIPEKKRIVAVDRQIMAGINPQTLSPFNPDQKDKLRRKYADMESILSDTQTTFLKGSGGVRIEDRIRNPQGNFTFQEKQQTPKVLAHINDQSHWTSRDAKNMLKIQSPINKQQQTLKSLDAFNKKQNPRNIYSHNKPKVAQLITTAPPNLDYKYFSTPTISLNGRFLKSVGDCGLKLVQKDVQLFKPPVGNSVGLEKFKTVRYVQRDIFNAQNSINGKRMQQRVLRFKKEDDNEIFNKTKLKQDASSSETSALVESENEETELDKTNSQQFHKAKTMKRQELFNFQDDYQLFTGSRKAFEESIDRKVAQRLPEFNIVQVTDEFYSRHEDINLKNLRLKKQVIKLELNGVNLAFEEDSQQDNQDHQSSSFAKYTLAQIETAYNQYEKNREAYLKSYRMLQRFMDSTENLERLKEQEKQNELKRRDSQIIEQFQRQLILLGDKRLGQALSDPIFVALLKLRDIYEDKIKAGYKVPKIVSSDLEDEQATMLLIKTLLQELGQTITSQPKSTADGEEVKEETCDINQQSVTKYAKQAGDSLVSKVLNGVPLDAPKHLGQRKQRKLINLIQVAEFQDTIKSVVSQLTGQSEQVQVTNKKIQSEEFYRVAKEAVVSASAKEDFAFKIQQQMQQQFVPAMPIFTKIQQGVLSLIGYKLAPAQAKALASYVLQQQNDGFIKSISLHNNNFREEEFQLLMQGLANQEPQTKTQDYLQQLTYSHNEFGEQSCESLSKICNRGDTCHLKTLVLNGLSFKQPHVMSKICKALIPADQMLKLVLKDMRFDGVAVTNLCQFLSTAFTLQDLQLVNCSFTPQQLAAIAKQNLTSPSLQTVTNFSLKQNILRKHSTNKEFIADLIKYVQECPSLIHLDLSGMNFDLSTARQLLQDGVYRTQRLACVHIGHTGGDLPLKIKEQGEQQQQEQQYDYGEALTKNHEQIMTNLQGLLQCHTSLTKSMLDAESHMHRTILDFNETQTEARMQEQTNQVVFRLSNRPDLYKSDLVEELFKGCSWQKTNNGQCWICNGHQLMLKELKNKERGARM